MLLIFVHRYGVWPFFANLEKTRVFPNPRFFKIWELCSNTTPVHKFQDPRGLLGRGLDLILARPGHPTGAQGSQKESRVSFFPLLVALSNPSRVTLAGRSSNNCLLMHLFAAWHGMADIHGVCCTLGHITTKRGDNITMS